ncbi:MAG: acyl-phosphate glycerol 3-phosphate acyltransferase [Legionella sp.]|nr:MAG: acyl-phosphate glycerol 3-phosphate acyltransferase [Legionella sp.]
MILIVMTVFLAYGMGSVCSAVIVSHLCHLPDPRLQGSRNPGTTNVLRIAGKKYAIIVLLADMLKGLIPVVVAKMFHMSPTYLGYIGLAAVLGHVYPIFFNFKGGKGVATTLGVLFGLDWLLGLVVVITWLLVAVITRYSSLAAIIALSLSPVYAWFIIAANPYLSVSLVLIVGCVLYQHLENMQRLMQGKESKIKI